MVTCQVCGKKMSQLQSHIRLHNLTSAQYKDKFPGCSLMSDEQIRLVSERMKNGQSAIMAKKAKGCKKPNFSKLMAGNKRGLGTDRSAEKDRYSAQAKKQHLENNFGTWDDDRRKSQSELTKERWRSGSLKHVWTPKWEKDLSAYFQSKNIKFSHQYRIPEDRDVNGYRLAKAFNFYLPDCNLLVELHGCFWHGCRKCYKPHPIQVRVIENDKEKERIAVECGYKIIQIWEHDKNGLYEIIDQAISRMIT